MIEIHEANSDFDFSLWKLRYPLHLPGGNSFCKLASGTDRKSLYIETPICVTKTGFTRTAKKMTCDLIFNVLEHSDFLRWTDRLVDCLQTEIMKHSCLENSNEKGHDIWFQNDFGGEEIDDVFIPIFKTSAGGRNFNMRVSVPLSTSTSDKNIQPAIKVYDEDENDVAIDFVTSATKVIGILEVKGIKSTAHNFVVDITIKQMMITKNSSVLETDCILVSRTKLDSETAIPEAVTATLENKVQSGPEDSDLLGANDSEKHQNLDSPLKTSFSEKVDVFEVPSLEDSISEQSHLPDVVCSENDDIELLVIPENSELISDIGIEDLDIGVDNGCSDLDDSIFAPSAEISVERSVFEDDHLELPEPPTLKIDRNEIKLSERDNVLGAYFTQNKIKSKTKTPSISPPKPSPFAIQIQENTIQQQSASDPENDLVLDLIELGD